MRKKVVVVSTGGTIAMRYDPTKQGVCPAVTGKELVEAVPPLKNLCPIEVVEFSNIPSPHMTPIKMFQLAKKVEKILSADNIYGVVITHGTDTLEETAYLLNLVLKTKKPVCLTAAMRNAADISSDGPKNILCAVKTALSKDAYGKGVLVVMNEEIHSACEVTKTHAANPKTFASPFWGPLGYVDEDKVIFRRSPANITKVHTEQIIDDVHLIKLVAGSDDLFINFLVERQVKGIIVEGLGRGNVPPGVVPGIKLAIQNNIPVVLTTRTIGGRVLDVYGYEGGVKGLKELGVILGGDISGTKARIKLMLVLGITNDMKKLAEFFDVD